MNEPIERGPFVQALNDSVKLEISTYTDRAAKRRRHIGITGGLAALLSLFAAALQFML